MVEKVRKVDVSSAVRERDGQANLSNVDSWSVGAV